MGWSLPVALILGMNNLFIPQAGSNARQILSSKRPQKLIVTDPYEVKTDKKKGFPSTYTFPQLEYYVGTLFIGPNCYSTEGRKPDPVPSTQLEEWACMEPTPSCDVHPRFTFQFHPVIVEIR